MPRPSTPTAASEPARELGPGIWILDGEPIRFFGFPYALRSTVVDLGNGDLLVHSPVQLGAVRTAVETIGRPRHLVSPNKLHHLFFAEWAAAFPEARLYAPPGLARRRPDLRFHATLVDRAEPAWAHVLAQRVVPGSFFMSEVVFYHLPSRTLIVGDLVENHDPRLLRPAQRWIARANAMLAPRGATPRNFRWSFLRRGAARHAVREILSWEIARVVVMHGPCVEAGAAEFLRRAFGWLL